MKYDLVLEGGGAKGMVFVGAYDEFVRRGHTVGRLLGTSAGAISAVLLAAGYTREEMLAALDEKEDGKSVFAGFMGDPVPFTQQEVLGSAIRDVLGKIDIKLIPNFIEEKLDDAIALGLAKGDPFRHLFAFVERGGWFSAHRFVGWLEKKLDSGAVNGQQRNFSRMTLEQFYSATHADLSLVASDTSDARLLVLNHHTAPDCPVVQAVRMSMSIPLLWDEVVWSQDWGKYMGEEIQGHTVVDGGLLSNFPLELFVSDEPRVTALMGQKSCDRVLGWLIDESLAVGGERFSKGFLVDANVKLGDLRVVQRLGALVNTATTAHDKMVIEENSHLVVRLPAMGYGTTEFDMTDDRKSALIEAGRKALAVYFDHQELAASARKGIELGANMGKSVDWIATRILRLPDAASKGIVRTLRSRRRGGKRVRSTGAARIHLHKVKGTKRRRPTR